MLHSKYLNEAIHEFRTVSRLYVCGPSFIVHARALTYNSQGIALCSHWLCAFSSSNNSTGVGPIVTAIAYIHHQDVALLDPGCPLRINCSCITAPRTGPLIAQHSGGWHSYNSAHQNQGGALLHHSSVGVGINDNCKEMVSSQAGWLWSMMYDAIMQ